MTVDYSIYSDGELLQFLKNDDQKAFTELYERYWKDLYNTACKRLQDHEACQDIVQEIFADIWLRKEELQIINVPGYLHTAVRFQVLKFLEKNKKNAHFLQLWREIAQQSFSADSILHEKELARLLEEYLQMLPAAKRQVFRMRYVENKSPAEISAALNISPKTVRNQAAAAVQSIRVRLANFLSSLLV